MLISDETMTSENKEKIKSNTKILLLILVQQIVMCTIHIDEHA